MSEKIKGYTPGPWRVFEEDEEMSSGIPFISVATGECGERGFFDICHVQCTLDDDDEFVLTDRDRANAELIALAPTLYEENAALKAENERLREALKKADAISQEDPSDYSTTLDMLVDIGDVCRAVLGEARDA